jgi:hypothetical protein
MPGPHVRRLRLVRALLEVGGLSVAQVREVLAGVSSSTDAHAALGTAQWAITPTRGRVDEESRRWAASVLEGVARRRAWTLKPGHPVADSALNTVATFASLGHADLVARIDEYAELAVQVAELDLSGVAGLSERETMVEAAVVGIVLGDALFAALRRLAQEHASAHTFRPPG